MESHYPTHYGQRLRKIQGVVDIPLGSCIVDQHRDCFWPQDDAKAIDISTTVWGLVFFIGPKQSKQNREYSRRKL